MAHDPPSGEKKAPDDPSIAELKASTAVAAAPVHFPLRDPTVVHEHQTFVKPEVEQRTNDDRETHEKKGCYASDSEARQDGQEGISPEEEAGLDVLASAMMMSSEFSGSTPGREQLEEDSLRGSDDEGEKSYSDEDDRECLSSIQSSQAMEDDQGTFSGHEEHLSQPACSPFEIGVGLIEMEGAMVDCLRQLSSLGDMAPSKHDGPNIVYRCNICGFSYDYQDRIVEHMLLQHRMVILSSMQDLDRYGSQYSSNTTQSVTSFPALSESFQAVASALQTLPPINQEQLSELSESVAKTLDAGPGIWIIQHLSDKHRRIILEKEDVKSGPMLEREGDRTEEPKLKRHRVNWPPQQAPDLPAAPTSTFALPQWVAPMSHPIPAPIALPITTLSNMRWMCPPYGRASNMPDLFNVSQPRAFSFNPNGMLPMPLLHASTMEKKHAFSATKGSMAPTQKSLSSSLGEPPSAAATSFNASSLTKPLPQYASATLVQATNADIKDNPFLSAKTHERRVESSVKRDEREPERREGKTPDRNQHAKTMDQNRNNHQLIHV